MSSFMNEQTQDYLLSLYSYENDFLKNLRKNAEERKIPIITRDTEQMINTLLTIKRPQKMLELGTAIGYSSINFASICEELHITTIDYNEHHVIEARENIEKAGFKERITVLYGDAKELLDQIEDSFDVIFIDAAKGQYQYFFDHSVKNLKSKGVMISDNVLYQGMIASNDLSQRRKRSIVKRMRAYLEYITHHTEFETTVLPIGDGVAISAKKY